MWMDRSNNKLFFVERTDKYDMFLEPQRYLAPESSGERHARLDSGRKQQMIEVSAALLLSSPSHHEI